MNKRNAISQTKTNILRIKNTESHIVKVIIYLRLLHIDRYKSQKTASTLYGYCIRKKKKYFPFDTAYIYIYIQLVI